MRRTMLSLGAGLLIVGLMTGCVRRTISITSSPSGALVWLNEREIGRTPVDVEFVTYGTYDVRLEMDGYEPLLTTGRAQAPWWDTVGPDLFAELAPGELRSDVEWHFDMMPANAEPDALLERARDLRDRTTSAVPTDD